MNKYLINQFQQFFWLVRVVNTQNDTFSSDDKLNDDDDYNDKDNDDDG